MAQLIMSACADLYNWDEVKSINVDQLKDLVFATTNLLGEGEVRFPVSACELLNVSLRLSNLPEPPQTQTSPFYYFMLMCPILCLVPDLTLTR